MNPWTDDTWEAFCLIVEQAWPGEFTEGARIAWRVLLDDYDPDQSVGAVKRLVAKGSRFRPSVSEVAAEIRHDPSRPTFEEAFRLMFGAGGIFDVRVRGAFPDLAAMHNARHALCEARCGEVHPLVGSFAIRYGLERLRGLELDDPQYGELRRKELQAAWDRHVDATDGRDVAALVSGRRGELGRLDPLAAITGPRRELEAGT